MALLLLVGALRWGLYQLEAGAPYATIGLFHVFFIGLLPGFATGLMAALAFRKIPEPINYCAACTGVDALVSGSWFATVAQVPGDLPAVMGGLASLVCGWLTRPRS